MGMQSSDVMLGYERVLQIAVTQAIQYNESLYTLLYFIFFFLYEYCTIIKFNHVFYFGLFTYV